MAFSAPTGSAKKWRYEPDVDGIYRVATGKGVAKILTQRAGDAAREVKKLGPKKRGAFFNYKKSVRARPARQTTEGFEAGVEVNTPGWHLPEFGTANYRATAPLRRGVELAGLELRTEERGGIRRLFIPRGSR